MCIIAIKQAGKPMWTSQELKTMWDSNPHGAGFMYVKDGQVVIQKGFMDLPSLLGAFTHLNKAMKLEDMNLIVHFRITTHGGTKAENTHPFPISHNIEDLKQLNVTTDVGVVHNGIISKFSPQYNAGHSDTMEYIAKQLFFIHKLNKDFYSDKYALDLIRNAIGSKMAFLSDKDDIVTLGDFQYDEVGRCYSNGSWKEYSYSMYSYQNNYQNYQSSKYYTPNKHYANSYNAKQNKVDISSDTDKESSVKALVDDSKVVRGWYLNDLRPIVRNKMYGKKPGVVSFTLCKKMPDGKLLNVSLSHNEYTEYFLGKDGKIYESIYGTDTSLYGVTFWEMEDYVLYVDYIDGTKKLKSVMLQKETLPYAELNKNEKSVFVVEDSYIL